MCVYPLGDTTEELVLASSFRRELVGGGSAGDRKLVYRLSLEKSLFATMVIGNSWYKTWTPQRGSFFARLLDLEVSAAYAIQCPIDELSVSPLPSAGGA